jgi:cytochrome c oxidase accessory protein FixG
VAAARGGTSVIDPNSASEALPKFAPDELGDCIDCTICVQVCPTGIDIRNGLQYECIACGACIDACDSVMDKLGYPRGLIRYSTQNAIDGKPTRILRPRIIVYGLLLLALLAGWAWGVGTRSPLIAEVLRDRNALYRETAAGIENSYSLKLVNKDMQAHAYAISIKAPPGIAIANGAEVAQAKAEEVLDVPITLRAPASLRGKQAVTFVVASDDGKTVREVESSFFGPM